MYPAPIHRMCLSVLRLKRTRRSWSWKEVGCRKDFTTLAGRTSESREAVKTGEERSPGCTTVRERPDPRDIGEMGVEGENVEGGFEMTKRNYTGLCREDKWRKSHLSVRRWEFGKSTKDGECQLKGFRHHATTSGSLLGVPGRCGGWSVVQLDHDEDTGPMHVMYGTLDFELEEQRTIKRAELTAFFRWFMLTTKESLMAFGQERRSALAQK